MIKSVLNIISLRNFTKLKFLSALVFAKMVRYFQNPYEDYRPAEGTVSDFTKKEEIVPQIDGHLKNILKRIHPATRNVDGGLYVGVTGIAYMFYHLSKNPILSQSKHLYIEKGIEYVKPALQQTTGDKTAFILGDAGTYAVATVLFREIGSQQSGEMLDTYKSLFPQYNGPEFPENGGNDYFVGRAGYIAGALWLSRELQTPVLSKEQLYKLCDTMVSIACDYAKTHRSPCSLTFHYYNTQYLGAAHGASLCLQMLITVPGYLDYNRKSAENIKETIDYILSIQTDEGNWPCCLEERGINEHKLIHWCHGAPGTIYLMAKAYFVYHEQKYYDACIKAGELIWNKGLLRKGPGICHGVSGNAYAFLLLYRMTGDAKYVYRAKKFADFMNSDEFLRDARLPDNPVSLFEGTAGTVCFLSDLLVPDKAEFPFQDVFST